MCRHAPRDPVSLLSPSCPPCPPRPPPVCSAPTPGRGWLPVAAARAMCWRTIPPSPTWPPPPAWASAMAPPRRRPARTAPARAKAAAAAAAAAAQGTTGRAAPLRWATTCWTSGPTSASARASSWRTTLRRARLEGGSPVVLRLPSSGQRAASQTQPGPPLPPPLRCRAVCPSTRAPRPTRWRWWRLRANWASSSPTAHR